MNPISHIKYYIYLLQLENYHLKRFFYGAFKDLFGVPATFRKQLVWTQKMKLTVIVALVLLLVSIGSIHILLLDFTSFPLLILLDIAFFITGMYFFYIFLIGSTVLLIPLDYILKKHLIGKAREKINKHKDLIVVGVTGSYGKTTMKETLKAVLEGSFNVLASKENKNTPLGIARQILSELSSDTEVFIVEMGAYVRGDIKELTELVHPDIMILTGINEAHLERQGSIENIIETKFELITYGSKTGLVVLNADDENITSNFNHFVKNTQNLKWFSSKGHDLCEYKVEDFSFNSELPGISFSVHKNSIDFGILHMRFIARYIIGNAIAAFIVGEELGVTHSSVKVGLSHLKPVSHRLEPKKIEKDIIVIDDAYNGNPAGVKETLEALRLFGKRRKVYVTPGLVEMGSREEEVHRDIGRELAGVVDEVVFIKNKATSYIHEELQSVGFNAMHIHLFNTTSEAHDALKAIVKPGDILVFQNDVTENYL